jgi:multidrug efflux pump subunit AcrA (membrane-fusion protein)
MVAEVIVPLPPSDSTFVVPRTAVINSPELVYVVRVVNGKVQWVPVKTGRDSGGMEEVFGNLNEGDTLVLTASEEMRNGAPLGQTKAVKPGN